MNESSAYYSVQSIRWVGYNSSTDDYDTDHPSCGPGYYATMGGAAVWDEVDDEWVGGYFYSGYHYLPTYGGN